MSAILHANGMDSKFRPADNATATVATYATRAFRPKVAYIVSRFPKLTETFVLYELLEMERQGVEVELYSLLRQREPVTHGEVQDWLERAHFEPFVSRAVLHALWYYMRRKPRALLRSAVHVLGHSWGSTKFFFGALAIFGKAVRFAYNIEQAGVVHVHAQFANHPAVAALIVHRLTDVPFSFTARGSDVQLDRRMLKQKVEACSFAIAVCSYNKQLMVEECGTDMANKIYVIRGGIDVQKIPAAEPAHNKVFKIICVGRFEEVKGQRYLLEACRLLRSRGVQFDCELIGQGPMLSQVKRQIVAAGLEGRVQISGFRPYWEIIRAIAGSDVLVVPTVRSSGGQCEGIPNVLKEAMASARPVVGSASGGIPELVEDGVSGLLVPPGDTVALADALQKLQQNPELRARLGSAGREKIVRDFNLARSTSARARLFLAHSPLGTPAGARALAGPEFSTNVCCSTAWRDEAEESGQTVSARL